MNLLHILCLLASLADFSNCDKYSGAELFHTESKITNSIRTWLNNIRNSIPDGCKETSSILLNTKNQLLSYISCHETDAISKYTFSGKMDKQMRFTGQGVLTIDSKLAAKSNCIKVPKLFGQAIEAITGNFTDGVPNSQAWLEWNNTKAEVFLVDGVPHGLYRIEQHDRWAMGYLVEGQVNGSCWIVEQKYVLNGFCDNEDPWNLSFRNTFSNFVLMYDLNVIVAARSLINEHDEKIIVAQEIILTETQGTLIDSTQCKVELFGILYGSKFELNLGSLQRKYNFDSEDVDPCLTAGAASRGQVAEGDKSVAKAIRTYFSNLYKVSLDPSPVDTKKAKKFIKNIERLGDHGKNTYEAVVSLVETTLFEFVYYGDYDENGLFHGPAVMKSTFQNICFQGECRVSKMSRIVGTFEHGILQGLVVVTSADQDTTTYFIVTKGIIHSLVIQQGLIPLYPYMKDMNKETIDPYLKFYHNGIGFLGKFMNGILVGPVWYGLIGEPVVAQGFLYGNLDKKRKLTGKDVSYLYPDYLTALHGTFDDKIMKSAKSTKVSKVFCEGGLMQVLLAEPNLNSTSFHFDQASDSTIGAMLLSRDPYESETVETRPSSIENSGDGIFALRNISKSQLVALYNGFKFDAHQWKTLIQKCLKKKQHLEDAEDVCFKYGANFLYGAIIDLPEEYESVQVYTATLAHKANSKFPPATNAEIRPIEHPRFGLIPSIIALRDITKDEEIFVEYGYPENSANIKWYKKQKEKFLEEMKKKSNAGHDEI